MCEKVVIVHFGEIGLKGRNRNMFLSTLVRNMRQKLYHAGEQGKVRRRHSYLFIEKFREEEKVLGVLEEVSGVAWYAPALRLVGDEAQQQEKIMQHAEECARTCAPEKKQDAFHVEVRRGDKQFPIHSDIFAREVAQRIMAATPWSRQSKKRDADRVFYVGIYPEETFIFTEKRKGIGGLPVGTSGNVIALLSGGIDSPVAVFQIARRGCRVDFLHFTAAYPHRERPEDYKVARIAQHLSRFTLKSRLYLAPYEHFQLALVERRTAYEVVLFRRFMARVAERIAGRVGAQAVVTGDNVAQVASQTLANIVTASQSISLPILRPLLTYDKQDIVASAQKIGTYSLSLEPYKDCCSLIDRHPKTTSSHEAMESLEREVFPEYERLLNQTIQSMLCIEYAYGEKKHIHEKAFS